MWSLYYIIAVILRNGFFCFGERCIPLALFVSYFIFMFYNKHAVLRSFALFDDEKCKEKGEKGWRGEREHVMSREFHVVRKEEKDSDERRKCSYCDERRRSTYDDRNLKNSTAWERHRFLWQIHEYDHIKVNILFVCYFAHLRGSFTLPAGWRHYAVDK